MNVALVGLGEVVTHPCTSDVNGRSRPPFSYETYHLWLVPMRSTAAIIKLPPKWADGLRKRTYRRCLAAAVGVTTEHIIERHVLLVGVS